MGNVAKNLKGQRVVGPGLSYRSRPLMAKNCMGHTDQWRKENPGKLSRGKHYNL